METHGDDNRDYETAEADSRVMALQANRAQNGLMPPEARTGKEEYSPTHSGGSVALKTSWFWTLAVQNCDRINSAVCGNLYHRPRKLWNWRNNCKMFKKKKKEIVSKNYPFLLSSPNPSIQINLYTQCKGHSHIHTVMTKGLPAMLPTCGSRFLVLPKNYSFQGLKKMAYFRSRNIYVINLDIYKFRNNISLLIQMLDPWIENSHFYSLFLSFFFIHVYTHTYK